MFMLNFLIYEGGYVPFLNLNYLNIKKIKNYGIRACTKVRLDADLNWSSLT